MLNMNKKNMVLISFCIFIALNVIPAQDNTTVVDNSTTVNYNSTIEIIDFSPNNLIKNLSTIEFNDTNIQYNRTYTIKEDKNIMQPTSDDIKIINLGKNVCGINTNWMFGCIVILIIMCLLTYRKE